MTSTTDPLSEVARETRTQFAGPTFWIRFIGRVMRIFGPARVTPREMSPVATPTGRESGMRP